MAHHLVLLLYLPGDQGTTLPPMLVTSLKRDETVGGIRVFHAIWTVQAQIGHRRRGWHEARPALHELIHLIVQLLDLLQVQLRVLTLDQR